MNVTNNTIFITGGGSGIGLALAEAFLSLNNTVIICGRNPKKLAAAKTQFPALHPIRCDLTDEADVRRTVEQLKTDFNDLNVLVNNAGMLHMYDFFRESNGLEKIEREISTNLTAPIQLTKRLLPVLAQNPEAAIINVSSGLAYVPMAGAAVYCATKAALHSWTRSLRHQLAQTPVKVFEVLPPTVDTEMTNGLETSKISPQTMAAETVKHLRKDTYEIRVGQTKALYVMSRLVPRLAESILQKA
ncbi:MAG: SDR family NAD(P)-dependent oxidoreductase [Anaerolineae bacterium]|nr:SDR family NAD(P)-dependent oxidoreductase [Anaerolineae bacterium]